MADPRVPDSPGEELELPCGETLSPRQLDLGMREVGCDCGERHAVVFDVNPLARFVPEDIVAQLQSVVETDDDYDEFATAHLMGSIMEEYPEAVAVADVSDDGQVGAGIVWVTDFDDRRLHEVAVELLVELMDHAVSHIDNEELTAEFEQQMAEFDVPAFVDAYREQRDFESEHDTPV